MSDKLLDILKDQADISEQELMQYLQGNLTPEERHEIEKRLAASDMLADAEEGLSQLKNKENVQTVVSDLNKQLYNQLRKRRHKSKYPVIPNQSLLIITTFLILVLIVIAFVVIYKMQNG